MGGGRKSKKYELPEKSQTPWTTNCSASARNLRKSNLGGVIFGCKHNTIEECYFEHLFGLPRPHFSYVKNVSIGLPLFLFNYSDRKLHGVFEAASPGQLDISPYGWTADGSDTPYPAQVKIRVRMQCQPLLENQFRPVISENYYEPRLFWFELDRDQTNKLISLFSASPVTASTSIPSNTQKWSRVFKASSLQEGGCTETPALEWDPHSDQTSAEWKCYDAPGLFGVGALIGEKVAEKDEEPGDCERSYASVTGCVGFSFPQKKWSALFKNADKSTAGKEAVDFWEEVGVCGMASDDVCLPEAPTVLESKSSELQSAVAEIESKREIQSLKDQCKMLECGSYPKTGLVTEKEYESSDEPHSDLDEKVLIVGGYDGSSWLSALECYSPSRDLMESLSPMNFVGSHASAAELNGEVFLFGGVYDNLWYDTVESYNPISNQWVTRPSLNQKKGRLAGVSLNQKIFAIGGGNGAQCFSEVEMFDPYIGRWIPTQSMRCKRFTAAAAEINGTICVVGGWDGKDYLKSAERFDPREHSWNRPKKMSTKRSCHSLCVLNEKLYAVGGHDGNRMVSSVEVFDPRVGSWMMGESLNGSRGHFGAVVIADSLHLIGGLNENEEVLDTVECYKEGHGWELTNLEAVGKRCYFSAVVM